MDINWASEERKPNGPKMKVYIHSFIYVLPPPADFNFLWPLEEREKMARDSLWNLLFCTF
jgi:hypothetical protein